ncbi:MAG TPA: hypothetical protein VG889_22720 [Rhizomicrobium sp.]|nr:hypothetical protein [Rhizomicrobium sp.]
MLRWLKRLAIALAVVFTIAVGAVAIVWFFGSNEKRFWLAMAYAKIVANHSPPPIAASGVISDDANWMMPEPASMKFTAVLRKQFPPGTEVRAMRDTLAAQGFEAELVPDCGGADGIAKPAGLAKPCRRYRVIADALEYHWGGGVCGSSLTVTWTPDRNGRLVAIQGYYGATCL